MENRVNSLETDLELLKKDMSACQSSIRQDILHLREVRTELPQWIKNAAAAIVLAIFAQTISTVWWASELSAKQNNMQMQVKKNTAFIDAWPSMHNEVMVGLAEIKAESRHMKKMKILSQIREASGNKAAYQKFVQTMLKKFGVKSPAELEGDKKKEFYDALDAGWEGDNEEPEPGDKKESAVTENCGQDHSKMTGKCPECGKQLNEETIEENMGGLAKAMNSLSDKPEFKKIKKNLKSLSMRATETQMVYSKDKKKTSAAAKQIKTQLGKLASKVDKKAAAKLTKMATLAATYESVEEAVSAELSEAANAKSVISDLKKKLSLLNGDVKSGNINDIIGRLENIEIFIGKSVKDLKKNLKEAVSTDCRTKGYKEAVKRSLLRKEKRAAKATQQTIEDANKKTLEAANKKLTGEDMTAGGSDATGEIAGKDMPLKKKKTLKRFKDA
jgi:hypothetical protein